MSFKTKLIKNGKYSSYLNGKFHEFQGYEKCLEELEHAMQEVLDHAEKVQKENENLKDEHWKDERLQEMKIKLDQMSADYWRGFPITEEQKKAISEWQDQHWTIIHNAPDNSTRLLAQGAIGGSYEYIFIPTSIGTSGICRCSSCYSKMLRELGNKSEYKNSSEYRDKKEELVKNYDCEFEFQEIG